MVDPEDPNAPQPGPPPGPQMPPPPPPPPFPAAPAPPPWAPPAGYGQMPPGMYYDANSGLMLPNGVVLAGIGRRIGAYFLAVPLAIVTLGIGYLIWGLIVWGRGQTPALQVLGMRCWRPESNRPASWGWMALREIIGRLLEGLLWVISLITSFVLMCATKDRKTIHDYIGGTVVVYDPNKILANQ